MKRVIEEHTVILQYSPMTGGLPNIETLEKANVVITSKGFRKEIRKVVCRGDLFEDNISIPDKVPQVMVPYIDVLDLSVVPSVLRQRDSPSTVPLNDSRPHKINISFFKPGLCPHHLLGTP